jgi:hypothetical protein
MAFKNTKNDYNRGNSLLSYFVSGKHKQYHSQQFSATILPQGLTATGGLSVQNSGLTISGGVSVFIGGVTVTGGLSVQDFGVLVTPIFCFLTGNIIALIEKYCFSSLETYILYVLSISWLIWSIFYSFFVYRNFQISFFLTLFFFLIKFVYSKSIKSRKQVKRKKIVL